MLGTSEASLFQGEPRYTARKVAGVQFDMARNADSLGNEQKVL